MGVLERHIVVARDGGRRAYDIYARAHGEAELGLLESVQRSMVGSVDFVEAPANVQPFHLVEVGETLSQIAAHYGMTLDTLVRMNEIATPSLIYVGQRLVVVDIERLLRENKPIVREEPWWGEIIVRSVAIRPSPANRGEIVDAGRLGLDAILYGADRVQVIETVNGEEVISGNDKWYKIEGEEQQYVYSAHVKPMVLPAVPALVGSPRSGKWIAVYLKEQLAVGYDGEQVVYVALVSTGQAYPTPVGEFTIDASWRPASQRMRGGEPGGASYYDLPKVQYVSYFTRQGHALHGTYWHHRFGQPMSHGCVNMTNQDAKFFYQWAPGGTPVVVVPW